MARRIVWLFNMSIRSAIFPVLWKRAIVTLVQKSSKSAALSNFHPLSVLPVMLKLIERINYWLTLMTLICCPFLNLHFILDILHKMF